jgi:hypothetical protein
MNPTSIFVFFKILLDDRNIGVNNFFILAIILDQGAETLVTLYLGGLFV